MLTFIRHTSVNVPHGICYGITDVEVGDTFFDEAQSIKGKINGSEFHEIWSSPLTRCTQLADSLFGDNKYKTDKRIQELNFGEWERVPWKNIYALEYGKYWMDNYATAKCPGGEAFVDQIERVKSFYQEHLKSNNKNIAIVTHAGVIRAFMCYLQGLTPNEAFDIKVGYGEIVRM